MLQAADEELFDGGSPRVIVYGYEVPDPEHPPSPAEVPYVSEPEYPEYLVPSDDEAPWEDRPLPTDASTVALSPGYVTDSDSEEDSEEPSDDDDNNDDTDDEDDGEEGEEHLAPDDSPAIPVADPIPSAGDIEAFETDEAAPTPEVERLLALPPPPPPSALISLSPPSAEERLARCLAAPALPSSL
ncbi:hypothetical protein Tco_0770867 [Tanacetum coccineum]|uniref:Uncharacterized protein n=1 Tax=Tanacetum coccineum TaxID=301880 RepID=A0ABQ4ZG19_9ASTR